MTERDIIKVEDYTNMKPSEYEERFSIQEDLNEEILFATFKTIFDSGFPTNYFNERIKKKNLIYLKEYVIFYFTVKDDLDKEKIKIDEAVNDIDNQIEEMEEEAEANRETESEHEIKFEETVEKISDLSGHPDIDIDRTGKWTNIKKSFDTDYFDELDKDEQDKVDYLLYQLESYKDDYWDARDKREEYESYIETAKKNYEKAMNYSDELENYNHD